MIYYRDYFTNFCDQKDPGEGKDKIYSLDLDGKIHLNVIPGILKLSSKQFKTTQTNGYTMKEFEPAFGYFPTFMVKTNKIKDNVDKYVIVKIIHINLNISGTVERYIGDVGDVNSEKELCKIMSTCHWTKKIDRMNPEDIGIVHNDITPDRLDLSSRSNIKTVSVDPMGSGDIDDAISIEKISDDRYQIGIHIADPTSYILENSVLDIEVAKRAESVYLNSQTLHMFPKKLSTDLFSLSEKHKFSRAFSVILDIIRIYDNDRHGIGWNITKKIVTKTLIGVNKNMSYEQFQTQYLEDKDLTIMYQIGEHLFAQKQRQSLDKNKILQFDSKKMIEIFMIIANCTVAEKMIELSDEKDLSNVLIRTQEENHYVFDSSNNLYIDIDKNIVNEHCNLKMNRGELRFYSNQSSMNKHNTLNLDSYTHFTSPIRRYSDILVHRLLYNLISGSKRFSVHALTNNEQRIHQIFIMNHYKKYYKQLYQLERDIMITHHILLNQGIDPMNRIISVRGIVLDIIDLNTQNIKIIVKCLDCCIESDDELSKYFINTMHTIRVVETLESVIKLFDTIKFKICFLRRDVRKIRAYL